MLTINIKNYFLIKLEIVTQQKIGLPVDGIKDTFVFIVQKECTAVRTYHSRRDKSMGSNYPPSFKNCCAEGDKGYVREKNYEKLSKISTYFQARVVFSSGALHKHVKSSLLYFSSKDLELLRDYS